MPQRTPVELDLAGLKCPLPVLRTRRALRAVPPGALLTVICTDPLAGLDIPNLVREEGDRLEACERIGPAFRFAIRRGPFTSGPASETPRSRLIPERSPV